MAVAETSKPAKRPSDALHRYPFWAPRFWHGMALGDWLKLLWSSRFAVHPLRWAMALIITLVACLNSVLGAVQRLIYGRRLAATRIEHPPIFIIGHWRSGTTFLHELIALDDRFTSPSTFACFAPHHFLITSWILPSMLAWILPKQRSMDNVPTGWARPQEDEFALVSLGARSPYRTIAFPNRPPVDSEYLDMRGLSREELSAWQAKLRQFISALTIREQKPIVLKSPPHTGRVAALLELFPDARFIHIVRDPLSIYPSTERLWKALDRDHALQMPRHERLSEYVFDSFERMYAAYREDRAALDPSRLVEIRYEDLAADPVGQVEAIYEKLSLGEFERVRPKLNAIAAAQPEYKTNRYRIDADLHREIVRRWKWYFDEYDYPVDEEPS